MVPSTDGPPASVPPWEQRLPVEELGHSEHGIQTALASHGRGALAKHGDKEADTGLMTLPPGREYGLQLGLN